MKKFTLLLSALLMVSFLALAQIKMIVHLNDAEPIEVYANSVDSITFVDEATDPDTPVSPVPPTIPTKIKYEVEQANWLTYTSDSYQGDVNVVYKTVTTRGEDAKYKKEFAQYRDNELQYKYVVENIGNKDISQQVYPATIMSKWTQVWYDDARTKLKEDEEGESKTIYNYDNQGRLIAVRGYSDGVLTYDADFRYEGLVRYGIRTYRENGTIYQYEKDTITFYNNTFAEEAVKESRSKFSDINQTSYSYAKCEIGEWGRTKEEFYYVSYNNNNELDYESSGVKLFTWHDELYCTYTQESYSKYRDININEYVEYTNRYNGYFKYRYGGDSTTPDTPEEPTDQPGKESFVAKPFSVSATETVTFSPGNLQYHAANDEWRFAPNQTDYIGEDNANISSTYNGWIDLFGWGTGNNPTNKSTYDDDYPTFVDWGVNKIGNDSPNTWRTLTVDEWDYLINKRTNASQLIGVAQVDGVNGLILLPDAWLCPSDVTFKSGFHDRYSIEHYAAYQTFSASDWAKLEASGAVFFPAAGLCFRYDSNVSYVQEQGNYWSANEYDSYDAYHLYFVSDGAYVLNDRRYYGQSVRLVKGEVTEDEPEEDPLKPVDPSLPTVLGTAGKYTIAFKIPEALECDPIINFFGPFQDGYDISDPDAPVAEKIEVEGFENWYKVSFEAADPAQANGRLCPQMGGVGTWNAQGTYTLIKGEAEIQYDLGISNKISCKEAALGQVVYVDVTKWAQNPCDRPNEAGPATYEVIIKTDFPADLDPYNDIIVSATVGWYTDRMEMVYDPSYTGEGLRFTGSVDECPAFEQYKYVISYKGSNWIYEKGDNRAMPYGNKAKDEVTEWDSEPWNNTTSPNEPEEPITPPATPEIPDIPEIEQPAADKTTFLVRIENAACNDFIVYLSGNKYMWGTSASTKFSRVAGTDDWFTLTVDALTLEDAELKLRGETWDYTSHGYKFLDDIEQYIAMCSDLLCVIPNMYLGGKILTFEAVDFSSPCTIDPVYYSLFFHPNDGSGKMEKETVQERTDYTIPGNLFARDGYEFIGWNTQADGTGDSYNPNDIISLTENVVLFAQWK